MENCKSNRFEEAAVFVLLNALLNKAMKDCSSFKYVSVGKTQNGKIERFNFQLSFSLIKFIYCTHKSSSYAMLFLHLKFQNV